MYLKRHVLEYHRKRMSFGPILRNKSLFMASILMTLYDGRNDIKSLFQTDGSRKQKRPDERKRGRGGIAEWFTSTAATAAAWQEECVQSPHVQSKRPPFPIHTRKMVQPTTSSSAWLSSYYTYHNNTTEARHYLFRKARLLTNSCWEKRVASVAATALLVRTRGQEVSIFCMNIAYWSLFIATY